MRATLKVGPVFTQDPTKVGTPLAGSRESLSSAMPISGSSRCQRHRIPLFAHPFWPILCCGGQGVAGTSAGSGVWQALTRLRVSELPREVPAEG